MSKDRWNHRRTCTVKPKAFSNRDSSRLFAITVSRNAARQVQQQKKNILTPVQWWHNVVGDKMKSSLSAVKCKGFLCCSSLWKMFSCYFLLHSRLPTGIEQWISWLELTLQRHVSKVYSNNVKMFLCLIGWKWSHGRPLLEHRRVLILIRVQKHVCIILCSRALNRNWTEQIRTFLSQLSAIWHTSEVFACSDRVALFVWLFYAKRRNVWPQTQLP